VNPPYDSAPNWRRFARDIVAAVLSIGLAIIAFIAAADPYGLRAALGRPAGPIVDTAQRWSYPQVARGGAFDSAVFGSSTSRLLDPVALDGAFGGHFANLAMNAATPDEQLRLASLFLVGRDAKLVLFGLDATWCSAAPKTRTAIPFPDWLYEKDAPFGFLRQVNLRSLESAAKSALVRAGHGRPAIRGDGYAVFTPPEATYDPERARQHIASAARDAGDRADPVDAPMPALAQLEALLADLSPRTRVILAFMPVHARVQGQPGTKSGERENACKARAAQVGARRGVLVVDFRIPSDVTTQDTNYWDALHYRLPVAARIVAGLGAAARSRTDDPQGTYTVLARPSKPD
jgi:hypothetical protein